MANMFRIPASKGKAHNSKSEPSTLSEKTELFVKR